MNYREILAGHKEVVPKLWHEKSVERSIPVPKADNAAREAVSGPTASSSKPKNAVARRLKNKTYGRRGTKGRKGSKRSR